MMTERRHFPAEQKAAIVRRHLIGKEQVSDLSEELGIQPSQVHLWVKQVLDRAEQAFLPNGRLRAAASPEKRCLAALEAALDRKEALLDELLHHLGRLLVDRPPPRT